MSRRAPAPLLLANGFTDDVFPVDEALRYDNLDRALYPSQPISLYFSTSATSAPTTSPPTTRSSAPRIQAFFDHYVKGSGPRPTKGVTALTQSCPSSAPSGGPYHAATWDALHPGEVRYQSDPSQVILSSGGNPAIAQAFDPVFGGLACTAAPANDQGDGIATYRFPTATGSGLTLLGSPTVTARLEVSGEHAYIAARLLDVDPATNTETLVARGVYRIDPRRRTAARCSSCTRERGTSQPATSRRSSCWARTPRTRDRRTACSRSRCRTCGRGCRSMRHPERRVRRRSSSSRSRSSHPNRCGEARDPPPRSARVARDPRSGQARRWAALSRRGRECRKGLAAAALTRA